MALAAAEYHGPAAAAWAERRRSVYGIASRTLAQMARRRHVNLASVEGAATGVGGFITVVPDLVGLAWIQSRLVFFVAAAYGFDPTDPMRPAELLVLNGLYESPGEAREALDGDRRDRGRGVDGREDDARRGARPQAGQDGRQVARARSSPAG